MFKAVIKMGNLLLFCLSLFISPHAKANPTPLSAEYLRRFETAIVKQPVHGDVALLVRQGAKILHHKVVVKPQKSYISRANKFPYSLEYALWALRDEQLNIEKKTFSLTKDKKFESYLAFTLSHPSSSIDIEKIYISQIRMVINIMKIAIECKKNGFLTDLIGEPGYEYVSTHQLFTLVLAKHQGCITARQYEATLPIYATRVKNELDVVGDKLSDLQVERAAMLALIGRVDLIPITLIKNIIKSQRKDGFWLYVDNITPRLIPKEHTSALAYYLLAASQTHIERTSP
ncbi:MAG: hypothetical protein Q7S87_08070 [Agitococcus sp.]|nr:hypothetical protein [Agitococcus sp.]